MSFQKVYFFIYFIFSFHFAFAQENSYILNPLKEKKNLLKQLRYNSKKKTYLINLPPFNLPFYLNKSQYIHYNSLKKENSNKQEDKDLLKEENKQNEAFIIKYNSNQWPFLKTLSKGKHITFKPIGNLRFNLGVAHQKNHQLKKLNKASSFSITSDSSMDMGFIGEIGDHIEFSLKHNKKSTSSLEEGLHIKFKGEEDDIIKKIELGKVNFNPSYFFTPPIESLFGIKGLFQLGNTYIETIAAQAKLIPQLSSLIGKGKQIKSFEIDSLNYQENQHYFLSHYFKEHYDNVLENYENFTPILLIQEIELWSIEVQHMASRNKRSLIALRDLGELKDKDPPYNGFLYEYIAKESIKNSYEAKAYLANRNINGIGYKEQEHYTVIKNAQLLQLNTDYTLNEHLGYISLKTPLKKDQVLAVSFKYKDLLSGRTFKVGEFSVDKKKPLPLLTKLLKSTLVESSSPLWELMMKNIYSLGNGKIKPEKFHLNIIYKDPQKGPLSYLYKKGKNIPLLYLTHLDRLNQNKELQINDASFNQPFGDGLFDFIEGITIDVHNGNLIFPKREPFKDIAIIEKEKELFNKLYHQEKATLLNHYEKTPYKITGHYLGTSHLLGVKNDSLKIYAQGRLLKKGMDYTIKNNEIEMIDPYLKNTPYQIAYEDHSYSPINTPYLLGVHLKHAFSKNFTMGLSALRFFQESSKKTSMLNTIDNHLFSLKLNYKKEIPFLDAWLKKNSFLNPSFLPSLFNIELESAHLIPQSKDKAIDYIDTFDDHLINIPLNHNPTSWYLASLPEENAEFFMQRDRFNKRGFLSWYTIDYDIYKNNLISFSKDELSKNLTREVKYKEIFSSNDFVDAKDHPIETLPTFDLTFYPEEQGPYSLSSPLETPLDRWGGITQLLPLTNFESSFIKYLEFWIMDPFSDKTGSSGELLFHLGDLSEDILKDGYMQYENGLPSTYNPTKTYQTNWGKVPQKDPETYFFEEKQDRIKQQDLGLDGLTDEQEALFYKENAHLIHPISLEKDPCKDNFIDFLDKRWDNTPQGAFIIDRYKYMNNTQGNTSFDTLSTSPPDKEDIDEDLNLNTLENYYQYRIKIAKDQFDNPSFNNYIVAKKKIYTDILPNGKRLSTNWYQIRIPLDKGKAFGGIKNLSFIKHIRIVMKGFSKKTTLRFASLNLIGAKWNEYIEPPKKGDTFSLEQENQSRTLVSIGKISKEENLLSSISYISPKEKFLKDPYKPQEKEASLLLKIKHLGGDHKNNKKQIGLFRPYKEDLRSYKKIKLYIHAENLDNPYYNHLDKDLKVFLRLSSDEQNYYQYEIPIQYSSIHSMSSLKIWPFENIIELALDDLIKIKRDRNLIRNHKNKSFDYFLDPSKQKKISIKGNPSLGNISYIMIGVKNTDAKKERNLILWIDDLQLIGIHKKKSHGYHTQMTLDLAKMVEITLNGQYLSEGFSPYYQNALGRTLEARKKYMIHTKMAIDRFFPLKWNLRIPFYFNQSKDNTIPHFIYEKDIALSSIKEKETFITYKKETSYLLSISKEKATNKKAKLWDIENFSMKASYKKEFLKDLYYTYEIEKNMFIDLNYEFYFTPYFYKLFSTKDKKRQAQKNWLDYFNLNLYPKKIYIHKKIDKNYKKSLYQDITYLSKSSFITNYASLDGLFNINLEPFSFLAIDLLSTSKKLLKTKNNKKDSSITLKDLLYESSPLAYSHGIKLQSLLPLKEIPFLSFINKSHLSYQISYEWEKNLLVKTSNLIKNKKEIILDTFLDLEKCYGVLLFYRKIKEKLEKKRHLITQWIEQKNKKRPNLPILSIKEHLLYSFFSLKHIEFIQEYKANSSLKGFIIEPIFSYKDKKDSFFFSHLKFSLGSQKNMSEFIREIHIPKKSYLFDFYKQITHLYQKINIRLNPFEALEINLKSYRRKNKKTHQLNLLNPSYKNKEIEISTFSMPTVFSKETFYSLLKKNTSLLKNKYHKYESSLPSLLFSSLGYNHIDKLLDLNRFPWPFPNWEIGYTKPMISPNNFGRYIKGWSLFHAYQSSYIIKEPSFYKNYKEIELYRGFDPLLEARIIFRNNIELMGSYQKSDFFFFDPIGYTILANHKESWLVGLGYSLKNLLFKIKFRGKRRRIKTDLNIKMHLKTFYERKNAHNIAENELTSRVKSKNHILRAVIGCVFSKHFHIQSFVEYIKEKKKHIPLPLQKFKIGGEVFFTFGK